MISEEVVNEVEESRKKGGFEETKNEKVGKGFEAGTGELLVGGIEIIEVLVKTGGVQRLIYGYWGRFCGQDSRTWGKSI